MNDRLERRSFIEGVGLLGTAVVANALTARSADAQTTPATKPTAYEIKPLSVDPKSIKGISEKVLQSHCENNYVGAVKRLNAIEARLAELDFVEAPNFVINGLKPEQLIAANSMILHEAYFDSLGGSSGPPGALADAIVRDAEGQTVDQPMGGRSHDNARRWTADNGPGHVRACFCHGLRRQGCGLCRCVHGSDPLGQCIEPI